MVNFLISVSARIWKHTHTRRCSLESFGWLLAFILEQSFGITLACPFQTHLPTASWIRYLACLACRAAQSLVKFSKICMFVPLQPSSVTCLLVSAYRCCGVSSQKNNLIFGSHRLAKTVLQVRIVRKKMKLTSIMTKMDDIMWESTGHFTKTWDKVLSEAQCAIKNTVQFLFYRLYLLLRHGEICVYLYMHWKRPEYQPILFLILISTWIHVHYRQKGQTEKGGNYEYEHCHLIILQWQF